MTGLRSLSPRLSADLSEVLARQHEETEREDQAIVHGVRQVHAAFPHGELGDSAAMDLANAYTTIERCRLEDTAEGLERPRPMTRSLLGSDVELHPSVDHLPRRSGGFSMAFEHRTDERGEPMHVFNQKEQRWLPVSRAPRKR